MWTSRFWLDSIERAFRSFAQGALFVLANRLVIPEAFYKLDVASVKDLVYLALYAGSSMFILSVLSSIATAKIGPDKASPSVVQDLEHQGLI